jgi:phosphate transport system substrate-binding protein
LREHQEYEVKRTSIRRAVAPAAAVLALGLTATACSASNEGNATGTDSDLSGTLAGGGASTQQAAMGAWAVGFQNMHPDVTVEYDPIGSGGGRENFISKAFPFAGSDSYLDNEEGELDAAKERCGGTDPIEVPSYVSPIAIVFNLEGVDELNLTPEAVAGIFSGKIKKWNDPVIADANPDAELPSTAINAVHRSDESGTTENFTEYISSVVPKAQWTAGTFESWPKQYGGQGAKGTQGVVDSVESGVGSIGYADASQAGDLGVAKVGVGDEFVGPTAEAAAKILEVSPKAEGAADNQLIFDLDRETQEAGTYPVVLTSYLLACEKYEDAKEAELVKAFVSYVISEEGQQTAADEAGAAPLSEGLRTQAEEIVGKIS